MAKLLKAAGAFSAVASAGADAPCCKGACEAPLVKMYSVDAPHGFCGESCMDPKKFGIYKKFEPNLTVAEENDVNPCSHLLTPSNTKKYTDYFDTVTHGDPFGLLTATLDLYAPTDMPKHGCCATPLFASLNCVGIPGKPTPLTIFGTGPYCCPKGATEEKPCGEEAPSAVMADLSTPVVAPPKKKEEEPKATPCCDKKCEAPMIKMYSVDAPHGFCGESCMDPKKFDIYKKFEPNLTIGDQNDLHPCSKLYTPSNTKLYTDYFDTVTHGDPFGLLSVTLDLYAPTNMPDHSCCATPLLHGVNCFGKPARVKIFETGPFCCPEGATPEVPCPKSAVQELVAVVEKASVKNSEIVV